MDIKNMSHTFLLQREKPGWCLLLDVNLTPSGTKTQQRRAHLWGNFYLIWIGEVVSNPDLWARKTQLWSGSWGWEAHFNLGHAFCWKPIYWCGRRELLLLPACPGLASTSLPSQAVGPRSLGVQHILKTSRDMQPRRLSSYWILGLSFHSPPLLN